jgi:hypothetical protein
VEFEDDRWPWAAGLPERGGRVEPGRPARVHVQVHHRGEGPLADVRVRVLAVPACLRPPDLPTGPWLTAGGDPPAGSPWRPVGPPAPVGDLDPGRSVVASFDWQVPRDLPRDICLLAVATAGGGLWTAGAPPSAAGLRSSSGGPGAGGGGSDAPAWAGPLQPVAVDPADLVTGNGNWGCKSVTVLGRGSERAVRLDLLGGAGRGPFGLAAEGWLAELTAGLVLPRRLGGLAVAAGLVPGRVGEAWRPELVTLVRQEPGLAERLDLSAAYAIAPGRRGPGLELWLHPMELDPERAEPFLLLLGEPSAPGRGSLLLLDDDGGVLGGHTFRVAR